MSETELAQLGADIRKNGLLERVKVFSAPKSRSALVAISEYDQKYWVFTIADGASRFDGMELDGQEVEVFRNGLLNSALIEIVTLPGEVTPEAYVMSMNIHRRHLTTKQRREVVETLLRTHPEKSNREIAKKVKVDDKTVGAVRRELESTAEIPQLKKTVGKDGKARKAPVRKKNKESPARVEAKPVEEPESAAAASDIAIAALDIAPIGTAHIDPEQSAAERKAAAAILDIEPPAATPVAAVEITYALKIEPAGVEAAGITAANRPATRDPKLTRLFRRILQQACPGDAIWPIVKYLEEHGSEPACADIEFTLRPTYAVSASATENSLDIPDFLRRAN
jgi:hypothetical protein